MLRIDLHCHSEASEDCRTPLSAFPARCQARGIRVQAITDHNVLWGAQRLRQQVRDEGLKLEVIVGEEISTRDGELVGLFLHEVVLAGLSAEESIRAVHDQGGLVLLPHGFDPLKRHRLRPRVREALAGQLDIVEGFNAHVSAPLFNRAAARWAWAHGLPVSGGSDAHAPDQIGGGWTETVARPVQDPGDLLELLWLGQLGGHWTQPVLAFLDTLRSPSTA